MRKRHLPYWVPDVTVQAPPCVVEALGIEGPAMSSDVVRNAFEITRDFSIYELPRGRILVARRNGHFRDDELDRIKRWVDMDVPLLTIENILNGVMSEAMLVERQPKWWQIWRRKHQ